MDVIEWNKVIFLEDIKMIKVAMLSFWHVHAKDYAKQATDLPGTEIVAVWDEIAERGKAEAVARGAIFYEN
jgi:1,5-anhydro-D-fructose reductase (1,5-anhydro-D-mannitol-forming)